MRFDHTPSPVLVLPPLPPQLPPRSSFDMAPDRPKFDMPFLDGDGPIWADIQSSPERNTPSSSIPSAAGRKRSRDEAGMSAEEEYFTVQPIPPLPENEDQWEYGEGMTLIKPGVGYAPQAASQSGTWIEDKAEQQKAHSVVPGSERPIIRSAKSQRLDSSSIPIIAEEVLSNGTLVAPSADSPTNGHAEPAIDGFTRHLGIGWSEPGEDKQPAIRAWNNLINKQFPITGARIILQGRSVEDSFLVEANEGYFLVGEDLKQARLVSKTKAQTWVNLGGSVPTFEGDVIQAIDSPTVAEGITPLTTGSHFPGVPMGGIEGTTVNAPAAETESLDVEMGMSE